MLRLSRHGRTIAGYEIVEHNKRRIQLWSNYDKTSYAIYLITKTNESNQNIGISGTNNLLVANNHSKNIKYTELLDESDYLEDMKYDWKYTLQHWISNSNGDLTITTEPLPASSSSILSDTENPLIQQQQQTQTQDKRKFESNKNIEDKNLKHKTRSNVKKKDNLKRCHFCKLEFSTNKERADHELTWHIHSISK
jgi:hypothetical protein